MLVTLIICGLWLSLAGFTSIGYVPPEKPKTFQVSLEPSVGPNVGTVRATIIPTHSFVVGERIFTSIEVEINFVDWMENESCMLELLFPNSITYIDSWSNITHQDWRFTMWDYEPYSPISVIYRKNITMWYPREGVFGLNVTVWIPKMDYYQFYFPDFISIRSYEYLEAKRNTYFTIALTHIFLGLTIITVGPVFIQLIDIIENLLKKRTRIRSSFKLSMKKV